MKRYCYIENYLNEDNAGFAAACYLLNGELLGFVHYSKYLDYWEYTIFNIAQRFSFSQSFEEAYQKLIDDLCFHGFEIISADRAEKFSSLV